MFENTSNGAFSQLFFFILETDNTIFLPDLEKFYNIIL